ncbi:hypothetical protein H6P81_021226 [Aristolochia fimbriata]|uniref:Ribosomal protein L2 n=1 Tax=Aristolochia fimbriata TaxID=158543 RepID=A0AAV7DTG2_ARIFI|nr:hypothetical protein H6P81_021226 [Aristolochia fimbriata]
MTNCVNQCGSSRTRLNYYRGLVISRVKTNFVSRRSKPSSTFPIGRADIEGSKKQRRYERLGCHKPVIPGGEITLRDHHRGPSQCFVLIKRSVPLVRTSSESAVRRGSPQRGRSQSVPATRDEARSGGKLEQSTDGPAGWDWDPCPALEPILFQIYGSILPTSLAYIVPSTDRLTHVQVPFMEPFPLGLQSSHLNICYYHQDLHRRPLARPFQPRFVTAYPTHRGLAVAPTAGYGCWQQSAIHSGLVDWPSLSPLYPSPDERFAASKSAAGLHQSFPRAPSGIVHHLRVPAVYSPFEPFSEDLGRSALQPLEDPANQLPCALRLSVSRAICLGGPGPPYLGCIPKQPDFADIAPPSRQGSGNWGHPLWPHSMGLAPGPSRRGASDTEAAKAARFSSWALPVRPLLGESFKASPVREEAAAGRVPLERGLGPDPEPRGGAGRPGATTRRAEVPLGQKCFQPTSPGGRATNLLPGDPARASGGAAGGGGEHVGRGVRQVYPDPSGHRVQLPRSKASMVGGILQFTKYRIYSFFIDRESQDIRSSRVGYRVRSDAVFEGGTASASLFSLWRSGARVVVRCVGVPDRRGAAGLTRRPIRWSETEGFGRRLHRTRPSPCEGIVQRFVKRGGVVCVESTMILRGFTLGNIYSDFSFLPLNDKVGGLRSVIGEPPASRAIEHFTGPFNRWQARRCVQRAGA